MAQPKTELRHELEERLRFETLLAEISARFVHLPAEELDGAIEDAQRRICESLELDLSVLWQWSDEKPRFMTVTHLHSPPEGPSRPERINARQVFLWVLQKMLNGGTLAISTEELPPEDFDRLFAPVLKRREQQIDGIWDDRQAMLQHIQADEWQAIISGARAEMEKASNNRRKPSGSY